MNNFLVQKNEEIIRCLRCGECQEVCPVYLHEGIEGFVARGKLRLIRAVMTGELEGFTPGVQERIQKCLNCNACLVACPSGMDVDGIVSAARMQMRADGIPLPDNLQAVRKNILESNNPFGLPKDERGAWAPPGLSEKQSTHLYFAGCSVSYSQNRMGKASLRLLDAAGIDYTVLGNEEQCCGDPLIRMGDRESSDLLNETNRRAFESRGIETLFASCAGCLKSLKHHFGAQYRVLHISEFIAEQIENSGIAFGKPFEKRVAYFDGCDIGRHAGVYDAPRDVLKRIPGLELIEFERNRQKSICCGGPFMAAYPDLAVTLASERIADAMALKVDTIAVACPTCLVNLKEGTKRVPDCKLNIEEVATLALRSLAK